MPKLVFYITLLKNGVR